MPVRCVRPLATLVDKIPLGDGWFNEMPRIIVRGGQQHDTRDALRLLNFGIGICRSYSSPPSTAQRSTYYINSGRGRRLQGYS